MGLAAKPAVPKVPLGVLLLATWILDVLAIVFGFAGIERGGSTGLPLSHGLFMSVTWSLVAAFLAARIYRDHRAGLVVGLLVFSHWVLDFVSHPIPFPSFSWRSWQWSYGHPLPSRSSTSLRRLTESRTRPVQLHQCGRSHGIGVWNVHSGGRSLRDVRFQEEKNWNITPGMNRR